MTSTITKRADELKPGDVIVGDGTSFGNRIVVDAFPAIDPHDDRIVVDAFSMTRRCMDQYWLEPGTHAPVESPALTPAQQHAEELLELVRDAENMLVNWQDITSSQFQQGRHEWATAAKPLLAKIDLPAPPTLEEALQALAYVQEQLAADHDALDCVDTVLDRARRTGMLKE